MPRYQSVAALAVLAALSACSTTPSRNTALEDARNAIERTQADSRVSQAAPTELQRARMLLGEADAVWRDDEDKQATDHLAYLARQHAAIAEQRARQRAADENIATATAERDRVRLEARTREADLAKQQADLAKQQAQAAQAGIAQAQLEARSAQLAAETASMTADAEQQRSAHLQQQLQALAAQQTQRGAVVTLHDVVFDFDKADLKPGAERVIERLAVVLKENPTHSVLIEGFTDSVGSEEYNRDLSERRAKAVRDALVGKGAAAKQLDVRGYGKSFPVATNDTAEGRQLNRRVEVVIADQGKVPMRTEKMGSVIQDSTVR